MIPSLYPSFRTGIHWTVRDIRGQVSREIHPESGSPRQSSGVGNLRVVRMEDHGLCCAEVAPLLCPLDTLIEIISIAQQARPNVIGQIEDLRAQLIA